MNLITTINQFYFDMTINELRLMNTSPNLPNITYNSLLYLDIIAYKKNCTVSFIAKAMNVAKSAVTLKIKELLNQGLIDKTISVTDKRVHYLTVKPNVIEEYKIYNVVLHNAIAIIENKYSATDVNMFCDMLNIIGNCYNKEVNNAQLTS